MATGPTIYQKKQAARRASSDIERLAKTYQTGMFDVVQQQQKGFTDWTANTKALMAPYEESVKKYTSVDFPAYQSQLEKYQGTMSAYEAQASAYRQRLDAFNKTLLDYEANPKELIPSRYLGARTQEILIEGKQYSLVGAQNRYVPAEYYVEKNGNAYEVYKMKPVPTFTEEPPKAPDVAMPTAPTPPGAPPSLPTFDTAPFQQKREELGTTFKREVGERKAAKQNVVMRRMTVACYRAMMDKVEKVMGEYKAGTLKSSSGQKVKSRDQAIAIALSESERAKRKRSLMKDAKAA